MVSGTHVVSRYGRKALMATTKPNIETLRVSYQTEIESLITKRDELNKTATTLNRAIDRYEGALFALDEVQKLQVAKPTLVQSKPKRT